MTIAEKRGVEPLRNAGFAKLVMIIVIYNTTVQNPVISIPRQLFT
ncbi:3989_t:CDS:2 [Funneliformis geosporum]|uniref:3989_t:CDS:1 n=1 Tax=Funneliformis geosporum TaxID=1117311 RepID=A0A9W4SKV8_9GLOM|nr:3989_t:CDS:2 [Funneliformis geosporum]